MKLQSKIFMFVAVFIIVPVIFVFIVSIYFDEYSLIFSLFLPLMLLIAGIINVLFLKCPHCEKEFKTIFVGNTCPECKKGI